MRTLRTEVYVTSSAETPSRSIAVSRETARGPMPASEKDSR